MKQWKIKFEPRIKLNHDTYIDFYAQIRRNLDKESVNFKRHLFLNIAWRTFGHQLIINF